MLCRKGSKGERLYYGERYLAGDATRLQFDEAEEVPLAAGTMIIEVRYHYVAEVNYIDPADAEAKSVEDLRNGFVWLSPSSNWAAIAARDMEMRDRISHCLRVTTEATLSTDDLDSDDAKENAAQGLLKSRLAQFHIVELVQLRLFGYSQACRYGESEAQPIAARPAAKSNLNVAIQGVPFRP